MGSVSVSGCVPCLQALRKDSVCCSHAILGMLKSHGINEGPSCQMACIRIPMHTRACQCAAFSVPEAVAYLAIRSHILGIFDPQRQHIAKILSLEDCETPNLHRPR